MGVKRFLAAGITLRFQTTIKIGDSGWNAIKDGVQSVDVMFRPVAKPFEEEGETLEGDAPRAADLFANSEE